METEIADIRKQVLEQAIFNQLRKILDQIFDLQVDVGVSLLEDHKAGLALVHRQMSVLLREAREIVSTDVKQTSQRCQ